MIKELYVQGYITLLSLVKALIKKLEGKSMENNFIVNEDENNYLIKLIHPQDTNEMNWAKNKSARRWGEIYGETLVDTEITRKITDKGNLQETYKIINNNDFDVYMNGIKFGICLTFPDYYGDAIDCMAKCCHSHIWCGESSSYVMNLRMSGEKNNLGLVLTKGKLKGYSIERDIKNASNERGTFIVHPENFHLKPGEEYELTWELFWFENKLDFSKKLRSYSSVISISTKNYVVFSHESIEFTFRNYGKIAEVTSCEKLIIENGTIETKVVCQPTKLGELKFYITLGEVTTTVSFYVISSLDHLLKRRVEFITNKQQCSDENSPLYGAYLIYDKEENSQFFEPDADYNAGRERVGMGVLVARYLHCVADNSKIHESLDRYEHYLYKNLYNQETGEVYNDVSRRKKYLRLYNYPWIANFFLELFYLKGDLKYLHDAYRCLKYFYQHGGKKFYAIGIPMVETYSVLKDNGLTAEAKDLLQDFIGHGLEILSFSSNYPKHEVNYEQSIVAPAADYMAQLYLLTEDSRFLSGAEMQCELLDLFHGSQPDYHLYETAIRHWDGYWFGKRELYGDTFPHYWSALTANAFYNANKLFQGRYTEKIENIYRGILSLFKEDGWASCAMVYPVSVNGERANYYDPWANDQDWGLYFYFKYGTSKQN